MDLQMQQKCDSKLRELQESMPFLLRVLKRLRNNNQNDAARQTQLEKIQKLYNLLNDKSQTFKWDLLIKCENVVNKLKRKMELQKEAEALLRNRINPIEVRNKTLKASDEKNLDDFGCPESPPPQQEMDYLPYIQPVVIPTERCCSPPPISNKHRENQKPDRYKNSEQDNRRHSHHKHHHRGLRNDRHKEHEISSSAASELHKYEKMPSTSERKQLFVNEQDKNAMEDRYLLEKRQKEEQSRQTYWQRCNQDCTSLNTDKIWSHEQNTQQKSAYDSLTMNHVGNKLTEMRPSHSSVFARLGEKTIDSERDDSNDSSVFHNQNYKVNRTLKSQTTIPGNFPVAAEKSTPVVSDFLKSPPLSANDITELLIESNANSNSNSNASDSFNITGIGTRRSTPTNTSNITTTLEINTDGSSHLDMVRKKFALLTKSETLTPLSSPIRDTTSIPKSLPSTNLSKTNVIVPPILQRRSTPNIPTERIAFRYNPHPRSAAASASVCSPNSSGFKDTVASSFLSSNIPNNVNVLPTLRPNDPRLRKSNIIANGNLPTLAVSKSTSAAASKLEYLMSPSSTPSPVYGNYTAPKRPLSVPQPVPPPKTSDPRLQRSLMSLTHHKVSTHPLLVSGDSSDENWDLDDSARNLMFPQLSAFPLETSTHPVEETTYNIQPARTQQIGDLHVPLVHSERQSQCWDSSMNGANGKNSSVHLQGNRHIIEEDSPNTNNNYRGGYEGQQNKNKIERQSNTIPRTYGAYKEARAKAAAQFAAQKAAEEAKNQQNLKRESIEAEPNLSLNASLDTTYRNKNLTCLEHPKTIENFKIPRKTIVAPTSELKNNFECEESAEKSNKMDELKISNKYVKSESQKFDKPLKLDKTDKLNKSQKLDKNNKLISHQKEINNIYKDANSNSKSTSLVKEYNFDSMPPKSQRSRFNKKSEELNSKTDQEKSKKLFYETSRDIVKGMKSFENADSHVKNEVAGSDIVDEENSVAGKQKNNDIPMPLLPEPDFMSNQPSRILKRRCTMVERPSPPEVDKEKLSKSNALLFEDLQDSERKKKIKAANKTQTPNKRHGEICYEKTDDGCTVSTQNIITGKRRTRTTANFNEVQQGIAVFKHLKPNDSKKEPTTTVKIKSPAVRKKPGPKPKTKTETKIESDKNRLRTEHNAKEGASKLKNRRKSMVDTSIKINEEAAETLPNVTGIFDGFIRKILNPATNADELINKLRDILSQEEVNVLLSVRETMMKKQQKAQGERDSNDDISLFVDKNPSSGSSSKSSRKCNIEIESVHNTSAEESHVTDGSILGTKETASTKPKAPRRNELDRLHEDIRDMFISEGVLTATGKRMCTFVEPCSTKTIETDNVSNTKTNVAPSTLITPVPNLPLPKQRIRKTRVMLPTLKISHTTVRRQSHKSQLNNGAEEEKAAEIEPNKEEVDDDISFSSDITQTSSTTTSVISNDTTTASISTYTKSDKESQRRMPKLKPLKPNRLREEDELDEWLANQNLPVKTTTMTPYCKKPKNIRYKPCPKSKKPVGALLNDDDDVDDNSDGDIEYSVNDVNKISKHTKIKTEKLDIDVPYEEHVSLDQFDLETPKNTNPKWHWASRYAQKCAICNHKTVFISQHYKKNHSENYVSRLAPVILQQLKQQQESELLNKPILKLSNKSIVKTLWLHRCPFCLTFRHTCFVGWLEHFITHTGEYMFECTLCHKSFNQLGKIEKHMKAKCAELGGRYLHHDEVKRSVKMNNEIKAHVCHLCNFLRLGRISLEHHYIEQHGYDFKSINKSIGYVIFLMKCEDVPKAKSLNEITLMEDKLKRQYLSNVICLSEAKDGNENNAAYTSLKQDIALIANPISSASSNENLIELNIIDETVTSKDRNEKIYQISNDKSSMKRTQSEDTNAKLQSVDGTTSLEARETTKTLLPKRISSAFMSTAEDSNDGEAPTVLARKLLTVDDETVLFNKTSAKPNTSTNISMAERLSQRLKEAGSTGNPFAQQLSKDSDSRTASTPKIEKQNYNVSGKATTPNKVSIEKEIEQDHLNDGIQSVGLPTQHQQSEADTISAIEQQQNISLFNSINTSANTEKLIQSSPMQQQHQQNNGICTLSQLSQTFTKQSTTIFPECTKQVTTCGEPSTVSENKNDETEIDLTIEEDDDDWEDIEIVETGPSAAIAPTKSTNQTIHRNKYLSTQRLPRFAKSHKKTSSFKPLLTIFSGVSSTISKENNQNAKEGIKTVADTPITTPATCTSSTIDPTTNSFSTTCTVGFRPIIENLADLLPDSPSTDPIDLAPELAPSGPLQELSDITTLLGTNLSGLMDMDVEEPANSVCIHNTDNQQTSIQEALDFVASQTAIDAVENCLTLASITMNRIQNIGFTCSTSSETVSTIRSNPQSYKFYCFSDRCPFLYSSEAIGLKNHFLLEHPQTKWNGFCQTCATQIEVDKLPFELNISDEFFHLLQVHIKQESIRIPATTAKEDATILLENESNNSSNSNEQPRIKLRRLSGDCLSTASTKNTKPNNTVIDDYDDSNSFSDLIRFNPTSNTVSGSGGGVLLTEDLIPTSFECVSNDVPYFTNMSKDFEITSISSCLEPTELSAIVKSVMNADSIAKKANDMQPNSCNLRISNVISLGKSMSKEALPTSDTTLAEVTDSFPKIKNVCSLSSESPTRRIGSLWPQEITQERGDLICAPADSLQISNILANESSGIYNPTELPQRRTITSPGPVIVSETLPTSQATIGDFVITQTISAQYAEETDKNGGGIAKPKVGFNISISSAGNSENSLSPTMNLPSTSTIAKSNSDLKPLLNCMELNCEYTTRHFVAIIDHVKWHEKKNDNKQHEYLRCFLCKEKLSTVDAFTQHLRNEHYSSAPAAESPVNESRSITRPGPIESCALTEKIRNILNHNQVEIVSKEGGKSTFQNDANEGLVDNLDKENAVFRARLLETIKEMVAGTGISENKLFRCLVKDCKVKLNEVSYNSHVLYHISTLGNVNHTYPCPHCKGKCQNISALKTHIKGHGRHRHFCYLCMETASNNANMSKHFTQKHWQKKNIISNVLEQDESHDGISNVYYVSNSSSLSESNVRDFGKKLIADWQRKKAASRTHFNPDEIELLPIQAIFSKEIYCALCLYKTKVRTNMVRHMVQHKKTMTKSLESGTVGTANDVSSQNQGVRNANENSGTMIVCSMDPINPVPCLISNEKHFDRMTNLASSSHGSIVLQGVSGSGTTNTTSVPSIAIKVRYKYVPQSKRYKCGISNCEYLTICEDIFRSHLLAVHSETRSYQCLFCQEEICKRNLVVERVIQHLRFHDRTIYQCEKCDHCHYIRHVIDRHSLEKHGPVTRANILMFIRDEDGAFEGTRKILAAYGRKPKDQNTSGFTAESSNNIPNLKISEVSSATTTTVAVASTAKANQKFPKFICDLCQHETLTFNQLIMHSNSQHGFKQPYQCPYCLHFTAWSEANVKIHINDEHPGEILKVNRIFGKMSVSQQLKAKKKFLGQENQSIMNETPLKPLWQRDDPKRPRQIRGIPMEDEEESEKLRKRLRLSEDYDDEESENSVENCSEKPLGYVPSNYYLNRFEFGCFHCEYKSNDLEDLKNTHWESLHNKREFLSSKPFLFRLLLQLKCVECQNFIGCFWELQKHMTEDHSKQTTHAIDPRAKKLVCGYCEFVCTSAAQLLRHHLRDDHQSQDIKGITPAEMAKVMRLDCGSSVVFIHCSLCSELFNSRLAVVQHAGEKHGEESEHFSFRELSNTTIYRCLECMFTSTDELTTLRHMIDHYHKFKRCNFCNLPQTTFNSYMQHCYSDHRTEIRRFSEIYPLNVIRKYLMQVQIIFPNGWIVNKKNLRYTPYGNDERIKTLYAEICKTSQEPPIPRLSLGRLVARKSIEAKQHQHQQPELVSTPTTTTSTAAAMQLAGNAVAGIKNPLSSQKITKRRSTIAVGNDDVSTFVKQQMSAKKHKLSTHILSNSLDAYYHVTPFPPPKFSADRHKAINEILSSPPLEPYTFYGQKPEQELWSTLFTKISFAGSNTIISLDKFKILVQIDARIVLEKVDIKKFKQLRVNKDKECDYADVDDNQNAYDEINPFKHIKKACPASQKYRFT